MIIKRIVSRFFRERFFDHAAQIAYYLLLSMLPFLIFLFSLLSLFLTNEEALLNLLEPFTPSEAFLLIEKNVHLILNKNQGNILYASLLSAFWLSSVAVQALARSLDKANGLKRRGVFWKVLIRDLGITLLFMLVVPLSLFLPLIDQAILNAVSHTDSIQNWQVWLFIRPAIRWGLGTLFLTSFFILFYKVVPTGKISVRESIPGALFSAIGWQLFSLAFGKYVATVDYTMLYGQLSGIILLVLWFYLTAIIILISGLLNAEMKKKVNKRRS